MSRQPKKSIKLALQGGGSHGAFTWGVIDQLLEDERLHIAAVSGTSAGAMNAVALADGMARGGPAEARKRPQPWSMKVRFAADSPLEGAGFEPSVPRQKGSAEERSS
jgi:NTE family protein